MSDNRARLTVRLDAAWRLYTHALPGWEMLGTVERGVGDVGALARSKIGIYQQVNAGVCRSLDQRKVMAAINSVASEATS
jgi:hypothetical protein